MLRFVAILTGVGAYWWVSGDWSCVLVFVVPAALLVERVIDDQLPWGRVRRAGARLALRCLPLVLIGGAAGHALRVTPGWAFQEAMQIDPPPGVRVTRIARHYEGGPGEHTLIVEFTADAAAMGALLKQAPGLKDGRKLEHWLEGPQTWDAALNLRPVRSTEYYPSRHRFSRWSLSRIAPMTTPYDIWIGSTGSVAKEFVLLWERATGRGVLAHRRT